MIKHLDVTKETAITLAEVPNHIPKRNGKKAHYSTVYRWVTQGTKGRCLESVLVGGARFTTVEAVQRFLNVLLTHSDSPAKVSHSVNEVDEVNRALERDGYLADLSHHFYRFLQIEFRVDFGRTR